jgi:hypothetical protein
MVVADLTTYFAKVAPQRANGSPFATINALSLSGWRELKAQGAGI